MQSIFRNNIPAKSPSTSNNILEGCQILRDAFPAGFHVQGRSQCRPKFITDVPQNSRKSAGLSWHHLQLAFEMVVLILFSILLQVRGLTDNNNLNYPSELDKHRDADISSPTGRTSYGAGGGAGGPGLGMRGERESRDRGRGEMRDDLHSHRSSSSLSERSSATAAAVAAAVAAASGNASLQSAAATLGLTGGERSPSVGSASAAAAAVAAVVAAAAGRSASADVLNSRGDAGSDRGSDRGNDNSVCGGVDRGGIDERRDDLGQIDYSNQSKRDRDREVSTTPEHIISNKRRRKNSSNCDNLLTSTPNANVQDRHYAQDSQVSYKRSNSVRKRIVCKC